MNAETLDQILRAREAKQPLVLVTDLGSGHQHLWRPGDPGPDAGSAADVLRTDRATAIDGRFFQPFNPPLRLFIVGAVHIAQPMVTQALTLGFEVTVVDPRSSFGRSERFPGVQLVEAWPDEALEAAGLDHRCAVITLTHDPKLDDAALEVALRSPAFYIGCLGSKKTHAARVHRMGKLGFDEATRARMHGPLGLPLGGRAPAEVALSALAQMVCVLRGGAASS
jgi:xanthine dehydrogenase accessory factor